MSVKIPLSIILRHGVILLAVLFFVNMACACWQLATYSNPRSHVNALTVPFNPFYSRATKLDTVIAKKMSDVNRSFEFMTFARERTLLAQKRLIVQREILNARPFIAQQWVELIALERIAKVAAEPRLWSMEVALTLTGWSRQHRATVTVECLAEPPVLFEADPALCRRLLARLPYPTLSQNASFMGADIRFLKRRLNALNQRYQLGLPSESVDE